MIRKSVYKTGQDLGTELISISIGFLFAYTSISKLIDWHGTKSGLYNQVFPIWFADGLLYVLPIVEISVAFFLLIPKYRVFGFKIAVVLMTLFTGYILLVLMGMFARIPCSCGGVLNSLGWGEHFVFNLVVLGMAVYGVWIGKERMRDEAHLTGHPGGKNG